MQLPIYQVDAFASRLFAGNPAAVCPLDEWLPDATMQSIAFENNLSETAFYVPQGDGFRLRWFTPRVEVDLCGHATLATAFVIFHLGTKQGSVRFETRCGPLEVHQRGELLEMDLPSQPGQPAEMPTAYARALGGKPAEVLRNVDYWLAVYDSEAEVRELAPALGELNDERFAFIVTARGDEADFVSRMFAPQKGVPEDPVCGSAHCFLTPFWAERLGKDELRAQQVSERGGELACRLDGDRVRLGGRAVLYLEGRISV